ncbi:CHAT domain-containing protein [Micromonospora profundi]|uniref:CHAT domain-containing protein n=1 Tax=Micromonospora profundi TaxID=1420889 RepID=UPI0033B5CE19
MNVSRWRCDLIVVRRDGVTTSPLPRLTLREATLWADRYLTVLQIAEAADLQVARADRGSGESARDVARRRLYAARALEKAHQRADSMLADLQQWMWDTFAGQIVDELGFTATPTGAVDTWPRMWWCPTGPLTVLPLHTAGSRGEHGSSVLDRVISSYTPTLRALLQARQRDETPAAPAQDRLLFVDVPDLPGEVPIDNTAEREALFAAFPPQRRTVLCRGEATPVAVQAALAQHRWAHFSCHGSQNLQDPTRGGLQLSGGTLSIEAIAAGRFRGDFAGLSACKTAVGGLALLDEAITLASALHYTGYRHVIAALWSVDNQASAEVFGSLYGSIATSGSLEPNRAAAALHEVVRRMRDREPDWPHRWTPFTHIGP